MNAQCYALVLRLCRNCKKVYPYCTGSILCIIITHTYYRLNSISVMLTSTIQTAYLDCCCFQLCSRRNKTLMDCPAPNITLDLNRIDVEHVQTNTRRRRAFDTGRQSRDTSSGLIDYPDVYVTVGFQMDGTPWLRDITTLRQDLGTWKIYRNPELEPFPDENRVLRFRPAWPDYEKKFIVHVS